MQTECSFLLKIFSGCWWVTQSELILILSAAVPVWVQQEPCRHGQCGTVWLQYPWCLCCGELLEWPQWPSSAQSRYCSQVLCWQQCNLLLLALALCHSVALQRSDTPQTQLSLPQNKSCDFMHEIRRINTVGDAERFLPCLERAVGCSAYETCTHTQLGFSLSDKMQDQLSSTWLYMLPALSQPLPYQKKKPKTKPKTHPNKKKK